MDMGDGVGQGRDKVSGQPGRHQILLLFQPGAESGSGAVSRHDVTERSEFASLIHGHQVGMIEPGCGPGLAQETPPHFRRQQHFGPWHLHGHFAVQEGIPGEVDDAAAAPPQLAHNLPASHLPNRAVRVQV